MKKVPLLILLLVIVAIIFQGNISIANNDYPNIELGPTKELDVKPTVDPKNVIPS